MLDCIICLEDRETDWLWQAVKSVNNGTSFQQSFGLNKPQTTASPRHADNFVCEHELGHAVLGAQVDGRSVGGLSRAASGLLRGCDGLDVDRHCYYMRTKGIDLGRGQMNLKSREEMDEGIINCLHRASSTMGILFYIYHFIAQCHWWNPIQRLEPDNMQQCSCEHENCC